jgi:hypothetical protein
MFIEKPCRYRKYVILSLTVSGAHPLGEEVSNHEDRTSGSRKRHRGHCHHARAPRGMAHAAPWNDPDPSYCGLSPQQMTPDQYKKGSRGQQAPARPHGGPAVRLQTGSPDRVRRMRCQGRHSRIYQIPEFPNERKHKS